MENRQSVYGKARHYLIAFGRELDVQRLLFWFEGGERNSVIDALAKYQNADGGFGRALEPDLRTSASSVIATTQGLEIFREVGAPASSDMIIRTGHYLRLQFDPERHVWPIIPPEVEDAPHAPWWGYADSETNFGGFRVNPRAAVLGFLYEYPVLSDGVDKERILSEIIADVEAHQLDMHDILCVITLLKSSGLPQLARETLDKALRKQLASALVEDPTKWADYGLRPLDVVTSPDSPVVGVVSREVIDMNLDYLVEMQEPDGSWPVPWSWEFISQSEWARAEMEWKGVQVISNLKRLLAFGRIDPVTIPLG